MPLCPATADTQTGGMVIDLLLILAAAAGVAMLFRRLGLATIPGYLLIGAAIGPTALALISNTDHTRSISDLAILLLMFTIGLHLDIGAVRTGMVEILTLGIGSAVAFVLVAWPLTIAAGLSAPAALAISMALSMSSTAVVLRILQQRRDVQSVHGRVCFGVLIVQDLLALVILALLPPLAEWAGAPLGGVVGQLQAEVGNSRALRLVEGAVMGLSGIAGLILLGKVLLPRLLEEAAKDASAETLLVLSAAVALGAAMLTQLLGFSPELGAFLAGFLLASTPFRHQLSGQLAPMRDLFMAVYFTAVGLNLDVHAVVANWWIIALALPALLAVKGAIIAIATWAAGSTAPTAVQTGLALAQAGEFSLVILAAAGPRDLGGQGIIPEQAIGAVIAVVVLSLIFTPTLFRLGTRLKGRFGNLPAARWIIRAGADKARSPDGADGSAAAPGPPLRRHVIIAGFGVVGRNLAEHIAAAGVPFTVIELNPATVRRQRELGRSILFGDAANADVLESAGVRNAEAVLLTIPDDDATLRACRTIRALAPNVYIAARTSYLSRAIVATELGADHVTVEEVATARQMAEQVMRKVIPNMTRATPS